MKEKDFNNKDTREKQLRKHFGFKNVEPKCKDEYLKIPIDLPWKELEKDVPRAFEKFGWYGMIHRGNKDWIRSKLYGGLGLTYNPQYKFDIPIYAHGFGQPRAVYNLDEKNKWVNSVENYDYTEENRIYKDTYDDCLGLRNPTDVLFYRSFKTIFDKINFNFIQGRLAEIKAEGYGEFKDSEFGWHTDERNDMVSRILIPLVYSDDYFIEFKETGNRIYFEPGYAYHWDTYKVHRWNYKYHPNIKNRTCMVLGFAPWLSYKDNSWKTNKYFNKMHPKDMIKGGYVWN
jgi:hypothetical protein